MSNSESDRPDIHTDVTGERAPFAEASGAAAPTGESAETRAPTHDINARNRPTNPRNGPSKPVSYRPTRTSSAPPEEHVGEMPKAHFQPTKTQHTFTSTNDPSRRPPYMNQQSGYRPISGPGRGGGGGGDYSGGHSYQSSTGSEDHSTHDPSVAATAGSDTPQTSSTAPSPPVGEGVTIATNLDPAGRPPPHSPAGSQGDHPSSQGSPVFPPGNNRNYRTSAGGPMGSGSGSNSPHTGGPPGGFGRDGPYNKSGDFRENRDPRMNGGRIGGRRTQQQPPPGGGYNARGPPPQMGMGMHAHDPMGNPMMGRDPNRPGGGGYAPQGPMGQQSMAPPPQQWQQPSVQYVVDQYGNAIPQGQPAGYPGGYMQNPNAPQPVLRHQQQQQPPHPGGMMPQHQAPMQQPVMYGQMPPQQQQQQQQQQQHMMPVFQQPQQYIVQQPGQRFVQAPQTFVHQAGYPPGQYGAELTPEQVNAAVLNQAIMEMQAMGVAPGTQLHIQLQNGGYPMQVQLPPAQPFTPYHTMPNHPQHVQMQQQMHQQHQQQQMPMYVAAGHEMQGYPHQPHMVQQVPMQQPMGMPVPHVQPGMPQGAPQYQGYPQGGHPGQGPPAAGHYNQPPRHQQGYQGGPRHGQQYHPGGMPHDSPQPRPYSQQRTPAQSPGETGAPAAGAAPHAASGATAAPASAPSTTAAAEDAPPSTDAAASGGETAPAVAEAAPTVPVQEHTPVAAKERKVLSYKKKDGSALDIQSFTKKGADEPAASSAVPAVTTDALAAEASADVAAPSSLASAEAPPVSTESVPAPATAAPEPQEEPAAAPAQEPAAAAPKRSEVHAVPTVHEQLQGLRISPDTTPVTAAVEEETPLSPAIKFADLPVSLSSQPVSAYSTVSAAVASTDVPAAPASSPAVVDNAVQTPTSARNKKPSRKDILAKADAQPATSSDLSAYTESTAPEVPPVPVPVPPAPATPVTPAKSTPTVSKQEDSLPDSWDDAAELNLPPALSAATDSNTAKEANSGRSLRPGGKQGFNINLHQAVTVTRFTKQEILSLKPSDKEKLYNPLTIYGSISANEPSAPGSAQKGPGQWNKGQRSDARGAEGGEGWKRDTNMPSPAPGVSGKHRKSASNAGPMPKKVISDPMTLLATETTAILNKITPQTFEKLSQSMLTLDVRNIAQMNKVIELIFEKAVQEQGFANLYAALCTFLNTNATHWAFYSVFRVVDNQNMPSEDYFWIKECEFPAVYAGPYFSQADCFDPLFNQDFPPMQPVGLPLVAGELFLLTSSDMLVRISRSDKEKSYYVTYMPFATYGDEYRSNNTFADYRSALKDAKNKNFFRAKLLTNCQTEFQNSTMNDSVYSDLEEALKALEANKANLSEADFFYKSAEIEEKRVKLKRRMLGNIRFVGELFKQKLLTEVTILACISDLMGTPEQWKDMRDEQDIECLCHLLTTAGERLEAKNAVNYEAKRNLDMYFDRLRSLSRDKTLNSRMRFAIEEVLSLRDNGWQKRRGQEGPVKISEIHRKMQEEQSGGNYPPGAGRPGPGGPPPRQTSQQLPPTRIMARGGPAGAAGRGPQDVRKSAGGPGAEITRQNSAPAYEQPGQRANSGDYSAGQYGGRSQGGESARRPQSEYSSGAATPTSVGSGGGMVGSSSASKDPSRHVRTESERSIADELDFLDKTMVNRAKSVVTEFLDQNDVAEVKAFLSEGGHGACGFLLLQVIDKYLNAKKGPVCGALLALLADRQLSEEMQELRDEVTQALRFCEELKCLVDTTMDIKEAPEKFGSILAALVRGGVITRQEVADIVQEAQRNCLEELMSDEEDSRAIFERFNRQFTAEL